VRTLWLLLAAAAMGAAQSRPPVFTTLYSFGNCIVFGVGYGPTTTLALGKDGALYGAAPGGTGGFSGCVFRLAPPAVPGGAWIESTIYTFLSSSGVNALSILSADGVLYGTTANGGSRSCFGNAGCGTVFELQPPPTPGGAWTGTTLYQFSGGSDGATPVALVAGAHGVLYGVTSYGGGSTCLATVNPGCGVIFALTPPAAPGGTWTEHVLYSFAADADGSSPSALKVSKAGDREILFGATAAGGDVNCPGSLGQGCGVAFALTSPPTAGQPWIKTVIHTFTGGGSDGAGPSALAMGAEGALYVATAGGGERSCTGFNPSGCGTVVRLGLAGGWAETGMYKFQGAADGARPNGLVTGAGGLLYGTASGAGANSGGTLFRLEPGKSNSPWAETTLYSFTSAEGDTPLAGPTIAPDGVIFGTTSAGGQYMNGTAYQLAP